ncbi:MAG: MraY family glycosyltransferase [Candidatus Omnitrophica bacterium]|nr:MraY family glycosyltransferase [Candidatus Omnitrophota bacterium]MDD5573554.1 MraY family glycosyltransferase [Candidatus Omnitrophota bacterium]
MKIGDFLVSSGMAFCFAVVLAFVLRRVFLKYGFLAVNGVPCAGGVVLTVAFLSAAFVLRVPAAQPAVFWKGLFIPAAGIALFGFVDDLKNFSALKKLVFEIVFVAAWCFLAARTGIIMLKGTLDFLAAGIWMLWMINALNLLDVMDGLAGVSAGLACLGFAALSLRPAQPAAALLCAMLAASLAGFLLFNWPPARMYMGNSGSHYIGFLLGALALLVAYAPEGTGTGLASPLLVVGFFVFDTVYLVGMRLRRGIHPFHKSPDHLGLRLLGLGFSKQRVLLVCLGLCFLWGACAFLFRHAGSGLVGFSAVACAVSASLAVGKKAAHFS